MSELEKQSFQTETCFASVGLGIGMVLATAMLLHFRSIGMLHSGVDTGLGFLGASGLIVGCWAFGRLMDLGDYDA